MKRRSFLKLFAGSALTPVPCIAYLDSGEEPEIIDAGLQRIKVTTDQGDLFFDIPSFIKDTSAQSYDPDQPAFDSVLQSKTTLFALDGITLTAEKDFVLTGVYLRNPIEFMRSIQPWIELDIGGYHRLKGLDDIKLDLSDGLLEIT